MTADGKEIAAAAIAAISVERCDGTQGMLGCDTALRTKQVHKIKWVKVEQVSRGSSGGDLVGFRSTASSPPAQDTQPTDNIATMQGPNLDK
eukprot:CAMPEP_0195010430 /NCGR_PEP_ID=MMETSP0326_2-20130528/10105_1 /TAXON_ID=2866 ORGANISM="Crypthecodinium cohnii, Strain Seligo" /NCGR_SAMPLE_ID=MMETSP0326_2 /ASSEMBLY_ACC=CAM_ASM_000348 /LENGTH=90 /DNA_ID=CAMNT_0040019081 /DNA_START=304 /DNA_END=572 /DNA_ORIENTATION=-